MKIHLEELEHQKEAINVVLNSVSELEGFENVFSNPILQKAYDEKSFIDIKMETGTGKTYVYTRAMYELNRAFGLFKFVIVVPSLAIKEGAKNFIVSDYAKQHFSRFFPNKRIDLQLINAGDFSIKKGKRKNFPASIMQFCESTSNEKNIIQCLLISDKGFLDKNNSALFKQDYDQTLFGGYNCPIEAIKATKPILIIDEPHRFKRDGSTYKNIIEKINPQLIIRFGATFPEITTGKGSNKITKKDYYQGLPQYNLGAVEAFNKDLVKGVSVQFPMISEEELNVYKVKKVTRDRLILSKDSKEWEIKIGEDLSEVGVGFHGDVTYEGYKLSNELELQEGMELCEGIFTNSYQESLIKQALDSHFEVEQQNFNRDGYKIKTNSLFFIDSVDSYRKDDGWLKVTFERLLKEKLEELLKKYPKGQYHDFLLATKKDINLSHGGYFARDWGESDESGVKEEIEDILYKERTLSFKKEDNSWNIRRFFFSKWTLREGWDNPNIFTICKLRNSGSENSKIQEVGRGLRLPVDEMGNRLSGQNWKLNFIIGWNEKAFARKLVNEINNDANIKLDNVHLSDEMTNLICNHRGIDELCLLEQLDENNIIKRNNDFKEGGYEKLLELYPELTRVCLKSGKIEAPDMAKKSKIKLNKKNWEKIKEVWLKISKRSMVIFERLKKDEIISLFNEVLNDDNIFDNNKDIVVLMQETIKSDDEVMLVEKYKSVKNISGIGKMQYGDFVCRLSKLTLLPVQVIHQCLWRRFSELKIEKEKVNALLNQNTLNKIMELWCEKFADKFSTKYNYDSLNFIADTSVLEKGEFKETIEQGLIGKTLAKDVLLDDRNLYEEYTAYDSEDPEHQIEKISVPEKIKVFGKIPRRSIKVPTYTGGSTTPDFIYATEKDGKVDLTLLIETKSKDIRMTEKRAIEAQEKMFKGISNINWELVKEPKEIYSLLERM